MSKYHVGDKVLIREEIGSRSIMTGNMVKWFGGKTATILEVDGDYDMKNECNYYKVDIDPDFYFCDHDFELVEDTTHKTQRIEIPIPGGHLVAETIGWGGTHPGIFLSFIKSGDEVEHGLCFAEVCAEDRPDEIRVGTYYADCDDVKDIMIYPMDAWSKEE